MRKALIAVLLLAVFGSLASIYWIYSLGAVDKESRIQKIFVIQKGEGIRQIGNGLKKEGLIKDPVVFFIYIKIKGDDKNIQAGDYRLSPSMDLATITDNLKHGTLDRWITVPEGYRAEEIADILGKNIPSFKKTWRQVLNNNEGYLFPDTYLIPRDADINLIISIMRNNFKAKIQEAGLSEDDPRLERVIIIASLIEREAKLPSDRPLVASVIKNRLEIGMKLDIDATVQYALGYQEQEKRWWKKNLTLEDLKRNSPYNTYINAGLPRAPISNPGLGAIRAALNFPKTDYLYYVSDSNGRNHYAKTFAEHAKNIQKYLGN